MNTRYDELRSRITGPVYPVPPAFKQDYSLDLDAVAGYVGFLNSHNVRTIMTTAGTSRFNLLSNDEIAGLNRAVVDANNKKAVIIAAGPVTGSTAYAVEFAALAESNGADAVLLYYPERYYSDHDIICYVKEIASAVKIGVMIHAVPLRNARAGVTHVACSLDLWRKLAEIENVTGMKEENNDRNLRYKLGTHLGARLSIVAAGAGMRTLMESAHFGINSYLVGVGSFRPDIEEKFYNAMKKEDYKTALGFVTEIEEPFFDAAFPMGWHIAMKGAMDLLGLMPSFERPPLFPAGQKERDELRKVLKQLDWL